MIRTYGWLSAGCRERAHLPEHDLTVVVVLLRVGVDALVREGTAMLKVVQDSSEFNDNEAARVGGSLLEEIVRDGARQMLAAAIQAP